MEAEKVKTWKVELRGERTTEPLLLNAWMTFEVEASDRQQAEEIVNGSLPGFDWKFTSNYGAVEVEE